MTRPRRESSMLRKSTKLFPDDVRTIACVTDKIRTTTSARIIFRNESAKAAVPDWVCKAILSPEEIALKENLFVDSHLVYDENGEEYLRVLDWFIGAADRGHVPVQEALIPWDDIKIFKAETETVSMQ